MKQYRPGAGVTVFIIFFGIGLITAFQQMNWLLISFWLLMGAMFFYLDTRKAGH